MTKTYNIVTGLKYKHVEPVANRMAADFIGGCNHLTPAKEAELDNLFLALPETNADTVCEPDLEVLEALAEAEAAEAAAATPKMFSKAWMDNLKRSPHYQTWVPNVGLVVSPKT